MKKLRNFLLATICAVFITPAMAKENQITVHVKKNSMSAGEDGFSFKTTEGKEYYVANNPDYDVKGSQFIDDKKKAPICLTFDAVGSDNIVSVARGECK